MPLTCTQRNIKLRQIDGNFFIATRFNDSSMLEISRMVIDEIPINVRRYKTCEELGDLLGIDIHVGLGVPSQALGESEFFDDNQMSLSEFVFSLDRAAIKEYLDKLEIPFPERPIPKRQVV